MRTSYIRAWIEMKIETKYDIWDEIETLLWDVWIIASIKFVRN